MRASGVSAAGEMRSEDRTGPGVGAADDAGRLRPSLSLDAGSALWQGDPRLEGVVRAGGIEDPASGSLSCRRQRPSGPRACRWRRCRAGRQRFGLCRTLFRPGGWSRRLRLVVCRRGQRRSATRRRDNRLRRQRLFALLRLGRPAGPREPLRGQRRALRAARLAMGDDRKGPLGGDAQPRRARRGPVVIVLGRRRFADRHRRTHLADSRADPGTDRVRAEAINPSAFVLERGGALVAPLVPRADVAVEMEMPAISWRGAGYFDQNAGGEPLERAFSQWTWSRAQTRDGATILYDAARRREPPLSLALRLRSPGRLRTLRRAGARRSSPHPMASARGRRTPTTGALRSSGRSRIRRSTRVALIDTLLYGERLESVHESLSLDRFSRSIVRLMLPFRMPRR